MLSTRTLAFIIPLIAATSMSAQRLTAGTHLSVRLDRTVSSRTAHVGDRIAASLEQPIIVDGREIARRGTPVRAKVTFVRRSGRFHHAGELTVRLSSIDIHGRRYSLQSTAIRDKGHGHGRSNTEKIGGGAGIGAVIGAIAGGGKGALLGGLLGAGTGTGVAAATGRQPAEFRAESVYDFDLTEPARRLHHHRYGR